MFGWQDRTTGTGGIAEVWRSAPGAVKAAVVIAAGAAALVAWLLHASGAVPLDAASGEPIEVRACETTRACAEPGQIVVHVVGAVRRPGVYTAPSGSRVHDAIERAGGALGNAALEAINLARVLVDGEQVYVPTSDEASAAADAPTGQRSMAGGMVGQKVNLNTATAEELDGLPGIGPATAQKIIDDRARNGPFMAPEDLMRVPGIGPKKFDALKDLVTTR